MECYLFIYIYINYYKKIMSDMSNDIDWQTIDTYDQPLKNYT